MIQNAPLLILDENASSVDTRMERIVQNTMDKLTVGRNSFNINIFLLCLNSMKFALLSDKKGI